LPDLVNVSAVVVAGDRLGPISNVLGWHTAWWHWRWPPRCPDEPDVAAVVGAVESLRGATLGVLGRDNAWRDWLSPHPTQRALRFHLDDLAD